MPEYRRSRVPGGTYFFTLVTYSGFPLFADPRTREVLHAVWQLVQAKHPFQTIALCLLLNHLHCIWTLPEGDTDYSLRWKEIKRLFSHQYGSQCGESKVGSLSRQKRGEVTLWQRRFWEHTLRDEEDLHRHLDYIHYNPVKHGLVQRVQDWPWSSFHRYVKQGYYNLEWGEASQVKALPLVGGEVV